MRLHFLSELTLNTFIMDKRVYTFGNGQAEGKADMRNLLGGKGANLAGNESNRCSRTSGIYNHHRSL